VAEEAVVFETNRAGWPMCPDCPPDDCDHLYSPWWNANPDRLQRPPELWEFMRYPLVCERCDTWFAVCGELRPVPSPPTPREWGIVALGYFARIRRFFGLWCTNYEHTWVEASKDYRGARGSVPEVVCQKCGAEAGNQYV
jgi:hypothetical protein